MPEGLSPTPNEEDLQTPKSKFIDSGWSEREQSRLESDLNLKDQGAEWQEIKGGSIHADFA